MDEEAGLEVERTLKMIESSEFPSRPCSMRSKELLLTPIT
jgi:hypothetical protein